MSNDTERYLEELEQDRAERSWRRSPMPADPVNPSPSTRATRLASQPTKPTPEDRARALEHLERIRAALNDHTHRGETL